VPKRPKDSPPSDPRQIIDDPGARSILRTAQQRGLDATAVIVAALQAPRPVVLDAFQSAPLP
jgi:hypothetical protein